MTVAKFEAWVKWAGEQTMPVTQVDVADSFGLEQNFVVEIAVKFYAILMSCTGEDAFPSCHSMKDGDGLVAMWLLVKW